MKTNSRPVGLEQAFPTAERVQQSWLLFLLPCFLRLPCLTSSSLSTHHRQIETATMSAGFRFMVRLSCLRYMESESSSLVYAAELPEDTQMRFEMETDYSSTNATLADALWDSISTSHGAVALSDDFVRAKGLRPARRFPWDESKGLYHVQGVHLMHCVVSLRRLYIPCAQHSL